MPGLEKGAFVDTQGEFVDFLKTGHVLIFNDRQRQKRRHMHSHQPAKQAPSSPSMLQKTLPATDW